MYIPKKLTCLTQQALPTREYNMRRNNKRKVIEGKEDV